MKIDKHFDKLKEIFEQSCVDADQKDSRQKTAKSSVAIEQEQPLVTSSLGQVEEEGEEKKDENLNQTELNQENNSSTFPV